MHALFNREVPLPSHVDMFLVSREMPASNMHALKAVTDVDVERKQLEQQAEELASASDDGKARSSFTIRGCLMVSIGRRERN